MQWGVRRAYVYSSIHRADVRSQFLLFRWDCEPCTGVAMFISAYTQTERIGPSQRAGKRLEHRSFGRYGHRGSSTRQLASAADAAISTSITLTSMHMPPIRTGKRTS